MFPKKSKQSKEKNPHKKWWKKVELVTNTAKSLKETRKAKISAKRSTGSLSISTWSSPYLHSSIFRGSTLRAKTCVALFIRKYVGRVGENGCVHVGKDGRQNRHNVVISYRHEPAPQISEKNVSNCVFTCIGNQFLCLKKISFLFLKNIYYKKYLWSHLI